MNIIKLDTIGKLVLILRALGQEHPDMTVAELADRLAAQPLHAPFTAEAFAGGTPQPVVRECANCGHPVVALDAWGERWMHADEDSYPLDQGKGCRSASYSRDGDWDDTMDRTWSAKPTRVVQ